MYTKFTKKISSTLAFSIFMTSTMMPAHNVYAESKSGLASTSSANICLDIVKNETMELEILRQMKTNITRAAKVRGDINTVFSINETIEAADATRRLLKNPNASGVIEVLAIAASSYIFANKSKEEIKSGKERAMTLNDMIEFRETFVSKVIREKSCNQELYIASLANILRERLAIADKSVESIEKLITGINDQKNGAAPVFVGLGALGLAYTIAKIKTNYFVFSFFLGGISLAITAGGGFSMLQDRMTLTPLSNELEQAKQKILADRNQTVQMLESLVSATK